MLKLVQLRSMHSEIIPTSCNERTPTSYILRFFWCAKRALACINDINIYQQDVKNSFHWILALYFMDVRPAPQNAGLAPHWNYKKGFLVNICLTHKSLDVESRNLSHHIMMNSHSLLCTVSLDFHQIQLPAGRVTFELNAAKGPPSHHPQNREVTEGVFHVRAEWKSK